MTPGMHEGERGSVDLIVASDGMPTVLHAVALFRHGRHRFSYRTRTGALLRIDGAAVAAFDREHHDADVALEAGKHEITLEVEPRALPTNHLPPGDGVRWRLMLALASRRASRRLTWRRTAISQPAAGATAASLGTPQVPGARAWIVVGHAHLDVAWLWSYREARRRALRTFATAVAQCETHSHIVFAQSQPQLYAAVEDLDAALFARVLAQVRRGGFDASVASMWVEPDAHVPSGESLLRQFLFGIRYARERLGLTPSVAWLPDTFGFPSTFPTLAVHAGIARFATSKLAWNDTTTFPFARFRWVGDDGSEVVSALLASYDGGFTRERIARARERDELLTVGYGDGGGGMTEAMIEAVGTDGDVWTGAGAWLDAVARGRDTLPVVRGELYLEYHRGTYTTHRAIKSVNAWLEGELDRGEELAAWCIAVRLAPSLVGALADDLRTAWTLTLRNQFHDIAAGTITREAFDEVREDHERAVRIVTRVVDAARSMLPRGPESASAERVAPRLDGDGYLFENGLLFARARADGSLSELALPGARNVLTQANVLAAYVDRPRRWDAWNLDRGYMKRQRRVVAEGAAVEDGALVVRLRCGSSRITMQIEVRAGEPYVRVELAVAWNERHVILRAEHWLAIAAREAVFGAPHGTLVRTLYPETPAERAKYEVPAQRYVRIESGGEGLALFAADLYGWSARGLRGGGVHVGMSLLRSPAWPDPECDRGEHRLAYALVPTIGVTAGALEAAWREYAYPERVRLFSCDDDGVLVVAVKPAEDRDGVIVRVRECDGIAHDVALRCGGRAQRVTCVDAAEYPVAGDVAVVEESLCFALAPYALRSFRVRFS